MAAVGKDDDDGVERLFRMVLEELTCPICFEEFEDPKSLPYCAHNICTPCLNKMIALNPYEVVCPQCRVESPALGADDFPTNTLLVRLLLSTPKRGEKQAIRNALGEYKKGLGSAQSELDWMKRFKLQFQVYGFRANELKQEISQYADEVVEKIRAQERKLCSEVDTAYSSRDKRLENKLNERKMSLQRLIDQGNAYVKEIEKTLNRDGTDEIKITRTDIVKQLHEFLTAMNTGCNLTKAVVSSLDLQFVKGECHSFHLGQVFGDSTLSQKPETKPLTLAILAQASPKDQKQMLGEKLLPLIQQTQPELAGKITGMLLELDNAELLDMLNSPQKLQSMVEEAVNVLNAHLAKTRKETNQAEPKF